MKNDEYRKALFTLQNLLINHCPNFIKTIQKYYESHNDFINYINSKIQKYSLKINYKDVIKWIFEITDIQLKTKTKSHYKTTKRIKLMSIDDYKKKFIKKIFFSNKFQFSFYNENISNLFYYIPTIELSLGSGLMNPNSVTSLYWFPRMVIGITFCTTLFVLNLHPMYFA